MIGWEVFEFTVNRVYVNVGESLLLQYKGPFLFGSRTYPKDGRLADMEKGEIGVIEQMPGPGRYFYCPIWWERTIVKDEIVLPGEVAVVTSQVGKDLSSQHPAADEVVIQAVAAISTNSSWMATWERPTSRGCCERFTVRDCADEMIL